MMNNLFSLRIDTSGMAETMEEVQRMRTGLADRRHLHARLGVQGAAFTRDYVRGLERHDTANSLGAKPTNHHPKVARAIEGDSDAEGGIIRIPRSSGLGRAFHDVEIYPKGDNEYLTIPDDARTYGKRVREFPEGTFYFTVFKDKFPALCFRSDNKVGYWLRHSVFQMQDRSLLPSDKHYRALARGITDLWLDEVRSGKGGVR